MPNHSGAISQPAVDALVLDPAGPLHGEPDRLLREETPPATALRPVLDVIGNGTHRVSEIAGRLGKPASGLSKPLASLVEMGLVRRETPFGSDPRSGKRSLYRIDDPFLRLWFRVVAPHRAALAAAPRETRLRYWRRHRPSLESLAWEELCRMAVPVLHRSETTLAGLGPWEPAQRYWWGNAPELDVVARSVDGRRLLVGEAKWSIKPAASGAVARGDVGNSGRDDVGNLARAMDAEVCRALFVPPGAAPRAEAGVHVIDARAVMSGAQVNPGRPPPETARRFGVWMTAGAWVAVLAVASLVFGDRLAERSARIPTAGGHGRGRRNDGSRPSASQAEAPGAGAPRGSLGRDSMTRPATAYFFNRVQIAS